MEILTADKNQYIGINAHLHSKLQSEGGWNGFHASHIVHLTSLMKAQLRPLGYTAEVEESLQIRRPDDPPYNPESDVMVYDREPLRTRLSLTVQSGDTHELVLALREVPGIVDAEIIQHRAIGIYELVPRRPERGEPIGWVELLSPSNKLSGQDADIYFDKRKKLLQSGIVFVEIDYLHQSPPTFEGIASYRPRGKKRPPEDGSHPYRIVVIDPRPEIWDGEIRVRQFDVDETIPTVSIPLSADDIIRFDFAIPYQKTFDEMYYGDEVDYAQFPVNFDMYSPVDQAQIAARMLAILKAARAGHKLIEGVPLPVEAIDLNSALAQLATLAHNG